MSVLEEFWYGNLDPAEYDANTSKEYKEIVRLISRNEEKLLETMTEPYTMDVDYSLINICTKSFT